MQVSSTFHFGLSSLWSRLATWFSTLNIPQNIHLLRGNRKKSDEEKRNEKLGCVRPIKTDRPKKERRNVCLCVHGNAQARADFAVSVCFVVLLQWNNRFIRWDLSVRMCCASASECVPTWAEERERERHEQTTTKANKSNQVCFI